jgi:hypothetical protein
MSSVMMKEMRKDMHSSQVVMNVGKIIVWRLWTGEYRDFPLGSQPPLLEQYQFYQQKVWYIID